MGRRLITVLYEDRAVKTYDNYGPHMLLLACVADVIAVDRWSLQSTIKAVAKGGDSQLKATLREEGADLAGAGPLVAMFDDDQVRRCYGLRKDACKRAVLDAITNEATGSPTLILLQQNMEDLIAACCDVLGRPISVKKPSERDAILQAAAAADRPVRDAILRHDRKTAFDRLVRAVVRLREIAAVLPP
jgi:hypothetical protein